VQIIEQHYLAYKTDPMKRYAQAKLLVIDEVGYTRLTPSQARALFDLVSMRYE